MAAVALSILPFGLDLPPEGVYEPATATEVATRGTVVQVTETAPPPPAPPAGYSSDSEGGRCIGIEDLLRFYSPGWDVARMSKIAYRESRCFAEARNRSSSATGLTQILASHCPWLAREMGTWCTRDRLTDPTFNIRAAAALWREQGYPAWSTA